MDEKPIIEEGARFKWTCDHEVTVIMGVDYVDEDGIVHLTVQTGKKSNATADWRASKHITAKDIYEKVEDGYLEPQ